MIKYYLFSTVIKRISPFYTLVLKDIGGKT